MLYAVLCEEGCVLIQLEKQLKDGQRKSIDANKQNHALRKLLDKYRRVRKFPCPLWMHLLVHIDWTNV